MPIRAARSQDSPAIAKVHVESWRTTYAGIVPQIYLDQLSVEQRAEYWHGVIANTDRQSVIYVAEDDQEQIIGFAIGGPEREGDPTYSAEIYAIYVFKNAQRGGIGRRLAAAVCEDLKQRGHRSLLIWVLADNPSRGFYEALGGQFVREKEIEIGGAILRELAYGWKDLAVIGSKSEQK